MSWPVQGKVAVRVCGGQTRRLLLLTMASRADDDGAGVYSSVGTLAEDSEISASTVRRILKEFQEEGLIRLVGTRECSNGHTNVYDLVLDVIESLPLLPSEQKRLDKSAAKKNHTPSTMIGVSSCEGSDDGTPSTQTPLPQRKATPARVTPKPILKPTSTLVSKDTRVDVPKITKAPKNDKGERLPDDWALDAALYAHCEKYGYSESQSKIINEAFEDYWRATPGAKGKKLDWRAAFRNWVKNQKRWQVEQLEAAQAEARKAEAARWREIYNDWLRTDRWDPNALGPDRRPLGPPPYEAAHRGPTRYQLNDQQQGAAA